MGGHACSCSSKKLFPWPCMTALCCFTTSIPKTVGSSNQVTFFTCSVMSCPCLCLVLLSPLEGSHQDRCGSCIRVDAPGLSCSTTKAHSCGTCGGEQGKQGRETSGTQQQQDKSIILTYKGVDGSVNTMPYPGCINYNSCKQDGEINCDFY